MLQVESCSVLLILLKLASHSINSYPYNYLTLLLNFYVFYFNLRIICGIAWFVGVYENAIFWQ